MGRMLMVVAVMTLALVARADALVLCAKGKAGAVKEGAPIKARTTCAAKEVQVDPDATGLRGPQGPAGVGGTNGTNGTAGSPGMSGLEVVTADGGTIISGLQFSFATASCPPGKSVIAGGVEGVQVAGGTFTAGGVIDSYPVTNTSPQGWQGRMLAQSSDDWKARVYAVCATVVP